MASTSIKDAPARLPDGYAPVPLSAEQLRVPLRICIVAKKQPDPVAGHFVVLRDLLDGQVYLGCIADAQGQVQQWIEIWIQNIAGLAGSLPATREALTNTVLDERWKRYFQSFDRLDGSTILRTGWEAAHPPPTLIDLAALKPVHPGDDNPWALCEEDNLLFGKNLPAYSTSLHRYLYQPKGGEASKFIPINEDAPANESTKPLTDLLGGRKDLIALNPGGGLMLIRAYSPVTYETYVDYVGGATSEGIMHGRNAIHLRADAPRKDGEGSLSDDGWLYLGKHGKSGRLLETLHLKLRALADAVEAVRFVVREHQHPLLNLTADSFQARLGDCGSGLPTLWTARIALVDPGDALELPIEGTQSKYFVPGRPASASIYRPGEASHPIHGRCSLRIRQVLPEVGGGMILEGTFVTQERLTPGKNDLVWLRVLLGAGPVNLYARLETATALAAGEYRFRTIAQRFEGPLAAQVKAAAGVPIGNTAFEVLPQLSTPVDLYALGVLAARTLLVNARTPLPVALDELLSLARQVAVEHDSAVPLSTRIRNIFERDERWLPALGPQHLVHEEVKPEDAFDLAPPEVWWDVLATAVRAFPGIGPDSVAGDLGDVSPGGLHKVFDAMAGDLGKLLVRTRSLIVIDWRANREIHAVIRQHLTGMAG